MRIAAVAVWIIVGLGLVAAFSSQHHSAAPVAAPSPADPPLILRANVVNIRAGFFEITGEVENQTSEPIQSLEAVVSYYTSAGQFMLTEDALVEYQPLMPGQRSPFKVITKVNPQMGRSAVSFRMLGGPALAFADSSGGQRLGVTE